MLSYHQLLSKHLHPPSLHVALEPRAPLTFNLFLFTDLSDFPKRNADLSVWEQGFFSHFYSMDIYKWSTERPGAGNRRLETTVTDLTRTRAAFIPLTLQRAAPNYLVTGSC